MQTLTLEQLRATTDAGGVLGVTLKAQGAAFLVRVETRRGERVLVTAKRHEPRKFMDPRKALLLLRELGIQEMRVDGTQWRPEEIDLEKKARPDRAKALRQTHQAAAQAVWIQSHVGAAVRRAESVEAEWAEGEAVEDWLASWGQDDEKPAPLCG